jgi:hypothetical protein
VAGAIWCSAGAEEWGEQATGSLECWGRNGRGQLGDGTTTDSVTPVDPWGLTRFVVRVTKPVRLCTSETFRQSMLVGVSGAYAKPCCGRSWCSTRGSIRPPAVAAVFAAPNQSQPSVAGLFCGFKTRQSILSDRIAGGLVVFKYPLVAENNSVTSYIAAEPLDLHQIVPAKPLATPRCVRRTPGKKSRGMTLPPLPESSC